MEKTCRKGATMESKCYQNEWKFNTQTGDGKYEDNHEKTWFFDVSNHAKMDDDKNLKAWTTIKKTSQISDKKIVGTMSTPQRAFGGEAGWRQTQARDFWGPVSVRKFLQNREKHNRKKHENNVHPKRWELCRKGVKIDSKLYQNEWKFDTQTGYGKYHENHQKSCFSEW